MSVIGLDIGTSGVKSTLFDLDANVLAHSYREYNLICPGDGMFELDPNVLIRSALETLREVASKTNGDAVQAICITSYGESFVLRDKDGNILGNSMIYMDHRGTEQVELFTRLYPQEEIFGKTGCFLDPMFGVYKLRWIRENRPELLDKTKSLAFIADTVAGALGAEHAADYSLCSRSGMFDYRKKEWWDGALDFAGVDRSILPDPIPGGGCAGTMSAQVADDLGMSTDVRIILGGHDQILAAVGSGAYEQGDIANGMGTVDCFTAVLQGDTVQTDKMMEYMLPIVPYLDGEDMYVTYAFGMSGGVSIKWFRDTIAQDLAGSPDAYAVLNEETPPEPTSLIVIPYFGGGSTPDMDGVTPAAVSGMRLNTTRGELFRGFLEGETYQMRRVLECVEDLGVVPSRIMTVGGGSRSPLWMQIRADVFEHDICLPENNEAGTLASALLCLRDLGVFSSIQEGQKQLIHFRQTYRPNPETKDRYRANYARYLKILNAMKEVYRS